MLCAFQIGKEHVGLKAVTEILQDIQYKVNHYLNEVKWFYMNSQWPSLGLITL